MDLREMLLKEHSVKQRDRIVKYIGNDSERFAELMKHFFSNEYRLAQRSAWPMSYCVKKHPDLIVPYLKRMIDNLVKKEIHSAVIRNSVRVLQEIEVPAKFRGKLMDSCFNFIQSADTPVAIKTFSMTILDNMSEKYPEILPELKTIILAKWDQGSPAFRSRGNKILKKIA